MCWSAIGLLAHGMKAGLAEASPAHGSINHAMDDHLLQSQQQPPSPPQQSPQQSSQHAQPLLPQSPPAGAGCALFMPDDASDIAIHSAIPYMGFLSRSARNAKRAARIE